MDEVVAEAVHVGKIIESILLLVKKKITRTTLLVLKHELYGELLST
jgi:hypothetical protein